MNEQGEISNRRDGMAEDFPPGSFRDPAGRLLALGDRVFRIIHPPAIDDLNDFLSSQSHRKFLERGQVIRTWFPAPEQIPDAVVTAEGEIVAEHERIPFPSFPC